MEEKKLTKADEIAVNYIDTDMITMQQKYDEKLLKAALGIQSPSGAHGVVHSDALDALASAGSAAAASGKSMKELVNKLYGVSAFKELEQPEEPKQSEEEWIWVQGYKGTDKNMRCRDYQYELCKKHDMPDDAKIEKCDSGFHFCTELKSVFDFYRVEKSNRFFKVSALVRKSDYEMTLKEIENEKYNRNRSMWYIPTSPDKLAAKSIIFTQEVTNEELFEVLELTNLRFKTIPNEYRYLVREHGVGYAEVQYQIKILIADGYSEAFADFVVTNLDEFKAAHQVASVPDLSMDMKVLAILKGHYD